MLFGCGVRNGQVERHLHKLSPTLVLYVYGERDIVKLYIAFVCDDFVKMWVGLVEAVILWKTENEN